MIDFPHCLKSLFDIVEPNYFLLEVVYSVPVHKAIFCALQIHQIIQIFDTIVTFLLQRIQKNLNSEGIKSFFPLLPV